MGVELSRALLDRLVKERVDEGVTGIGLTGSHARGDASAASDVDLLVVTEAEPHDRRVYALDYVDGWLVSTSRRSLAARRADLTDPLRAPWAVEGLRQSRVLYDREGTFAMLIDEARAFDWADLRPKANEAAGHELVGLIEEVHKILGALEQRDESAALYASLGIVLGLGKVVGAFCELLFPTENRFFDEMYTAMGPDSAWTRWHREAAGFETGRSSLPPAMARATAAIETFAATVDAFGERLQPEDRAMVEATVLLVRSSTLPPFDEDVV